MKRLDILKYLFLLIFISIGLIGIWGCGSDGGDSGPEVIGPKVAGSNWSGFYFNSATGFQENLTATITHISNDVVIVTSKVNPPAQRLTGTISTNGTMVLTDASDGETWTTFFGPVTRDFVKVADFSRVPDDQEVDINVPIKFVELSR